MISIAPQELLQQFAPGQKVTLADLIKKADLRDNIPAPRGGPRGNSHPVPQPILASHRFNPHSKYFFDNCCHCASGKCDRCRAPGCSDRDWRKNGRDLP